MKLSATEL